MVLKKMKYDICFLLLSVVLIHSVNADPSSLQLNWELEGLSNPESVIYDKKLNHLYISNVNGSPVEKDGNGFISIISFSLYPSSSSKILLFSKISSTIENFIS